MCVHSLTTSHKCVWWTPAIPSKAAQRDISSLEMPLAVRRFGKQAWEGMLGGRGFGLVWEGCKLGWLTLIHVRSKSD